jgi:mRNA interferase MazF
MSNFNTGEIWLADLDPRNGSELGKKRPVLIIQNQVLLDVQHPSTLILPLTTNLIDNAEPLRIRINPQHKLLKPSDILVDQIRAIDNQRLCYEVLTICNDDFMKKIYKSISEVLGIGQ